MEYLLPLGGLLVISFMLMIFSYIGFYDWMKKRKFNKSIKKQRETLQFEKDSDRRELIRRASLIIEND